MSDSELVEVMELANAGNVPADWRVNMDSVKALNEANYDFEVLQVLQIIFLGFGKLSSWKVFTTLQTAIFSFPLLASGSFSG